MIVSVLMCGLAAASPSEQTQARVLFEAGVRAAEAKDFLRAQTQLEQSLQLSPRGPTAFNLAVAERALGHYRAAVELLEALQAGNYGSLPPKAQDEVQHWLQNTKGKLAHLEVITSTQATVRVDGRQFSPAQRIRLDPGTYEVAAAIADAVVTREVQLTAGEHRTIELVVVRPTAIVTTASPPADTEAGGWYTSPWFWAVVGAAVAGSAVTVGIALRGGASGEPEPSLGTVRVGR